MISLFIHQFHPISHKPDSKMCCEVNLLTFDFSISPALVVASGYVGASSWWPSCWFAGESHWLCKWSSGLRMFDSTFSTPFKLGFLFIWHMQSNRCMFGACKGKKLRFKTKLLTGLVALLTTSLSIWGWVGCLSATLQREVLSVCSQSHGASLSQSVPTVQL